MRVRVGVGAESKGRNSPGAADNVFRFDDC